MKACFAEEMRGVDRTATEVGNIPSIVLMENAALACVGELEKDFPGISKKSIAIFCGKGNNGGDGFAIARHLYNKGAEVSVFLVCGAEFKGDAKINFDIISKMDINIDVISDTENLKYIIRSFDIVVDAIYGTGIHGIVRGISGDVIDEINRYAKYILSVDIPSGIDADSGEICGTCINADKTVTFAAYKVGMLMFPGAGYTGKVAVNSISIPEYIINGQDIKINVTTDELIRKCLPKRKRNTHKGDYGKLLIIAGSKGMTGAAYMAGQAAVMAGCGLVTIGICESLNNIMEAKTTEVMTMPLDDDNGQIAALASEKILDKMKTVDAVLIGPGLGRGEGAMSVVKSVLSNSDIPVIVDADAVTLVAGDKSILDECGCNLIFTPHSAEMARLTGLDISYIENNRLVVSKEFCEEYGVSLILKGHHTIVTAPDTEQYINITGNPGLAVGGSGDVLAGITAAFAARGINETISAAAAVYIHGMAGDIAAEKYGENSLIPQNIIECIPDALRQILQVEN